MNQPYTVREANKNEFHLIGQLMVQVYSQLEGFPSKEEMPAYYTMLADIGRLTKDPKTKLLIAVDGSGHIGGGVVYIGDMKYYRSGGTAPQVKNAAGFRLLAVDPTARGKGLGKLLSMACIQKAKEENLNQMIIHSTKSMQIAWKMYEHMGFTRSNDLDFMQGNLPVFGFRLSL
ncbi:MAG TPA: GNAT family N-acetyltransferase [Fulvivirga sp.]|nr:GNAT family N-acetyltransferase [Fulvivirga sp.]